MLKTVDIRKELAEKYWHPPIPIRSRPVQGIVVHSTGDTDVVKKDLSDDVYAIAAYDTSTNNHITPGRPLPTITYTHYIEYDRTGRLVCWRTLDDNVKTSHAGDVLYHKYGWNSIYTSVVVDHSPLDPPDPKKMGMLTDLVACRCIMYGWDPLEEIEESDQKAFRVVFHRELKGSGWYLDAKGMKVLRKECPDHAWDPDEFRRSVCDRISDVAEPFRKALAMAGLRFRSYHDLVDPASRIFVDTAKTKFQVNDPNDIPGVMTEALISKLCEMFGDKLGLDFAI